jgi:hypothetical protein
MRILLALTLALLATSIPAAASRTFNGSSDVITINGFGTAIDNQSQELQIAAFIYFAVVPTTEEEPLSKADTGATQYEIYINASGQPSKTLGVEVRQSVPVNHQIDVNCNTQAVVGWNVVVFSFDTTLPTARIWCHNTITPDNTVSVGSGATVQGNHDPLLFGKKASTVPTYCACSLANVTILGTYHFTAMHALALYNGVSPLVLFPPPAVEGYWPLWGTSGTGAEPDYSLTGPISGSEAGTLTGTTVGPPCPCLPFAGK